MRFKNYVLLFIIYIFTVFFVIYFCLLYKNSNLNTIFFDNDLSFISIVGKNYDELYSNVNNYCSENVEFIIYVTSNGKIGSKYVQNNLEDVVKSFSYSGNFLYIDVDYFNDFGYINRLISDYGYGYTLGFSNLPVLIMFKNCKIVDVISINNYDYNMLYSILEDYYD